MPIGPFKMMRPPSMLAAHVVGVHVPLLNAGRFITLVPLNALVSPMPPNMLDREHVARLLVARWLQVPAAMVEVSAP